MSQYNNVENDETLGGRLRLLRPQELTAEQQELYHYLLDTKISWATRSHFQGSTQDGRLIGPFNVFLYSPSISRAYNDYTDSETKNTSLSPRVRQVIILAVGAVWHAAYELYAHTSVAQTVGLDDETIQAIKDGKEPVHLTDEEGTAYTFTHTLVSEYTIDDDLYTRALHAFGEKGVVDMIHLIGLYMTTSALLNAFEVPTPLKHKPNGK